MVAEALVLANPHFKFEEAVFNPQRYISLVTDDLLSVIKRSTEPELQSSAALLKRIDCRDIYKLVGEALVTKELKAKIKAADIVSW